MPDLATPYSAAPRVRSVSIDQAAHLLSVSRRTIYNRIRDGRLRTLRTLGGSQRVLVDSLHEQGLPMHALAAAGVPPAPQSAQG